MKFGYILRFISQAAENTSQAFQFAFPANSNIIETRDYLPASAPSQKRVVNESLWSLSQLLTTEII